MTSHRAERIADSIKMNISLIVQHEIADPKLESVEIINVALNKDLSHAKVFFSVPEHVEDPKEVEDALNKAAGFIRTQLAQSLNLRHTPSLKFLFDKLFQQSQKVEVILDRLRDQNDTTS